ncbi:MAG: uncharacterized protein KVP18_005250 [Porospora cf. gigantea A]|uniref:uncharacterized protein n=1 Tax=Porospora cf. gigantea A TaxID=2853593 RepID=UPI0035596380|nr:MAG: hypothetical protein KVP18_005250 [Porospora cf. gigantea A]
MYASEGTCAHHDSCRYAHGESELRYTLDLYKTKLCPKYNSGECRSSKCRFAHGEVDLRRNRKPKKKRLATRATPSTAPSPANETKQPLEAHPPEDSSTCPVTQNAIDLLLAHEGFYPSAPYCYYPTGEAQPSEGFSAFFGSSVPTSDSVDDSPDQVHLRTLLSLLTDEGRVDVF